MWYPAPRSTYGSTLIWDSTKQGSYTTLKYTRRPGVARPSYRYRSSRRNAAKIANRWRNRHEPQNEE
jgi:hypothetical protein